MFLRDQTFTNFRDFSVKKRLWTQLGTEDAPVNSAKHQVLHIKLQMILQIFSYKWLVHQNG